MCSHGDWIGHSRLGWERIMDSKSQNRELTTSELENVSGGMVTLDFGIVAIYVQLASIETGPMTGATICGNNGDCVSKIFGP